MSGKKLGIVKAVTLCEKFKEHSVYQWSAYLEHRVLMRSGLTFDIHTQERVSWNLIGMAADLNIRVVDLVRLSIKSSGRFCP